MLRSTDWGAVWRNLVELNHDKFLIALLERYYGLRGGPAGISVMEEDWDHLIVLDACRYDTFAEVNWLDGELERATSPAASTYGWLTENFPGYYDDVVYVSGNPFVAESADIDVSEDIDTHRERMPTVAGPDHFHDLVPVYMDEDAVEEGKVTPEAMAAAAEAAAEEHPDRRLIVHFVSPHDPYIGEEVRGRLPDLVEAGVPWPEIRRGYRDDLRRALDAVEDLLPALDGEVVITADHGELLGEYGGLYRHPPGVYLPELVEVPWFSVE